MTTSKGLHFDEVSRAIPWPLVTSMAYCNTSHKGVPCCQNQLTTDCQRITDAMPHSVPLMWGRHWFTAANRPDRRKCRLTYKSYFVQTFGNSEVQESRMASITKVKDLRAETTALYDQSNQNIVALWNLSSYSFHKRPLRSLPPCADFSLESSCLGVPLKVRGNLYVRLNTTPRRRATSLWSDMSKCNLTWPAPTPWLWKSKPG